MQVPLPGQGGQAVTDLTQMAVEPVQNPPPVTAPLPPVIPNNDDPQPGSQLQQNTFGNQQFPQLHLIINGMNQNQNYYIPPPYMNMQQPNPVPAYLTSANYVGQHSLPQGQMVMSQVQPNMTGGWNVGGLPMQQCTNSSNDPYGQKRKSMSKPNSRQQKKKR